MGNEANCKVRFGKQQSEGKALLETSEILFRGDLDTGFLTEIGKLTKSVSKSKVAAESECTFFAVDAKEDLGALSKISKSMKGAAALWIVYPKGQKHITENDVLAAGRKCGLKDVKVVGFSATHTALKFVIPISNR